MPALTTLPRQRALVGAAAAVGGTAVIAGAALPWLTVFGGLKSFAGIGSANGRILAVAGASVLVLGIWYALHGWAALRYAIALTGFILGLFTAYLLAQLFAVYRGLDGFVDARLGQGLFVVAAGTLLLIVTLFIDTGTGSTSARPVRLDGSCATPAALSCAAGVIHLMVAGQHFIEWPAAGAFFVVVGIAQSLWAALIVINGPSRALMIAATGNAVVVAIWVISRTSGLPFGPQSSVPEPVGGVDALTTAFEVALTLIGVRYSRLLRSIVVARWPDRS